MAITAGLLVDDVMRRWPATIRVFIDFRMRCVGCPIACFHTVADAAREHDVDGGSFLAALRARAAAEAVAATPFVPAQAGTQEPRGQTGFPLARE
jgi:hybrid cluster-associated redox disulfide protein